MDEPWVPRLREALAAADFTDGGVATLLGTTAHAALERGETTPALLATGGASPLETLVRLFLLQARVAEAHAEGALPGLVGPLAGAGLLHRSGGPDGEVVARVDVQPHVHEAGHLWVVADPRPGLDGSRARLAADHVLGVSAAATSLASLAVRSPAGRALDLGTGCGVLAMEAAGWAREVVATDVNPHALWLTRLNAALNRVSLDVREGSFFAPVADERFDRILSNPPFVVAPGSTDAAAERLVYRDSGLPGDAAVEHVVRTAHANLEPGGIAQLLANWVVVRGQPWEERLTDWVEGYDAWLVQRESLDPAAYVEHWLRDAGLAGTSAYRERYESWLRWFDEQGVEAVGFGWVNLRRTDGPGRVRVEDWPYDVAWPLGEEVSAQFARSERLSELDDDHLRALCARRRLDVVQETFGTPGAEHPSRIVLRQQTGMRRAREVDTGTAAFVGACDGELTVGQISAAVEQLTGSPTDELLAVVRDLVAEGYLGLP